MVGMGPVVSCGRPFGALPITLQVSCGDLPCHGRPFDALPITLQVPTPNGVIDVMSLLVDRVLNECVARERLVEVVKRFGDGRGASRSLASGTTS